MIFEKQRIKAVIPLAFKMRLIVKWIYVPTD
jgi:hypothetical protein